MASVPPAVNDPAGVAAASAPSSYYSGGLQRAYALLRKREAGTGLVAGLGAMFVLGMDGRAALQFAGIAALGNSVGDAAADAVQLRTQLGAYDYNTMYVDVTDMATAAAASGLFFWYLGSSGNQLMWAAGIAGVAAGVGPKITAYVGDMLKLNA